MKGLTKKQAAILFLAAVLLAAACFAAFRQAAPAAQAEGYVAVVRIDGEIYGGAEGGNLLASSSGAASERVMKELRAARTDPKAKSVLLRINSPGGSAAAAQEIAEEVDKVRSAGKPVVVSMGDLCASAGYWIASRGNYLFASPGTMTGSIGVYIDYNNVEGLMKMFGVYNEKIKSGAYKDILSMSRPMTEDERAMLQQMVDEIYGQFIHAVADGRRMDEAEVRTLADGRIYTGSQALDADLIDALGNYYDALNYAASLSGFGEGEVPVHTYGGSAPLAGIFSAEMDSAANRFADTMADRLLSAAKRETPAVK